MKFRKFARIFDFNDGQVLITKEEDDTDSFAVVQAVDSEEFRPAITVNFKSEESRDKYFEEYNDENARAFLDHITNQLS